jgi:hypothetical protein
LIEIALFLINYLIVFNQIQAAPGCALTSANTTQRPSEVFFGDHIEAINDVA